MWWSTTSGTSRGMNQLFAVITRPQTATRAIRVKASSGTVQRPAKSYLHHRKPGHTAAGAIVRKSRIEPASVWLKKNNQSCCAGRLVPGQAAGRGHSVRSTNFTESPTRSTPSFPRRMSFSSITSAATSPPWWSFQFVRLFSSSVLLEIALY